MKSSLKSPISLLIVEDDGRSMDKIASIVAAHFPEIDGSGATTLAAALEYCQDHYPQLLILDINLPDGDAFTLLEQLRVQHLENVQVIFITGHAGYALQAIKFSALDYLLKPFREEDLVQAVKKALQQVHDRQYHKQLEAFRHNISATDETVKIVLKTSEETHVVSISDIIRVEADDNYSRFYRIEDATILISQALKVFERKLDSSGFIRVHQSHLVNLQHIRLFNRKKLLLRLVDGSEVPVSQGKKNEVQNVLERLGSC